MKSIYQKLEDALDLACMAGVSVTFNYFEALELRGYIKDMKAELAALREQVRQPPEGE